MFFNPQEKIFSLRKTVASLPKYDLTKLWEEFYCYLLIAGFYLEGDDPSQPYSNKKAISDKEFYLFPKLYSSEIGRQVTQGLKDRYRAINDHEDTSDKERFFLNKLNYLFTQDRGYYIDLTGKDLYSIALARNFGDDMLTIAHYVAVTYGQKSYPEAKALKKLYLSAFGNIHLSNTQMQLTEEPLLPYMSLAESNDVVTPLFSLASSQLSHFVNEKEFSGDALCDYLSGFNFLNDSFLKGNVTTIPTQASINVMTMIMGLDEHAPIEVAQRFYRDFFYGSLNEIKILRTGVLINILHAMMKKMGETQLRHLFTADSPQYLFVTRDKFSRKTYSSPSLFSFALEALEAQETKDDAVSPSDETPEDESSDVNDLDLDQELSDDADQDDPSITEDPQTSPGGYDPTNSPPSDPVGKTEDNDNIGLISLDKAGEGVDDDLYRSAIVALNDRLKQDENLAIDQKVKDALDYWVNGFLYKASVQSTKDYVASLKLAQYLKVFN